MIHGSVIIVLTTKHFIVDEFGRSLEISSYVELGANDALAFWWIPLYTWRVDRPMRVTRRLINARGHAYRVCVSCVCVRESRWMLHGVVTRPIVYGVAYVIRVRVQSTLSKTMRSAKESRSRIPEANSCKYNLWCIARGLSKRPWQSAKYERKCFTSYNVIHNFSSHRDIIVTGSLDDSNYTITNKTRRTKGKDFQIRRNKKTVDRFRLLAIMETISQRILSGTFS